MMVGRVIYEDPKERQHGSTEDAPVVLKVENLNAGKMVQDVSFELRKGEILGFSGLMGAGRTETARALFRSRSETERKDLHHGQTERPAQRSNYQQPTGCC